MSQRLSHLRIYQMKLQKVAEDLKQTLEHWNRINPMLEITVSNGCNQRCSYCFEHQKVFSRNLEEEARQLKIVDKVCKNFDHTRFGRLTISFWGGEPLMNDTWLKEIVQRTVKYEFVDYHMFTNGTLIDRLQSMIDNRDLNQAFKCGRFEIQVSYDGEPHHSQKRGYSGDRVIKTIELLKEKGIQFHLKATITEDSIHMMPKCWESYEQLYDRFGRCIAYSPSLDTSSQLSKMDVDEWKEVVLQLAKNEFRFIKKNKHPLMSWFNFGQKKICDIRHSILMHSDGNLYLCHGAPYLDEEKKNKFILATTRQLENLDDPQDILFRDDNIFINAARKDCLECEATFCGMCHIQEVDSSIYQQDWIPCISRNKKKCQLYKEFGKIARALKFSISRNCQNK